jgi:hypothetical protein
MRIFLFKILFRLTWWVAPKTKRVQRFFSLYVEFIDSEDAKMFTQSSCRRDSRKRDSLEVTIQITMRQKLIMKVNE